MDNIIQTNLFAIVFQRILKNFYIMSSQKSDLIIVDRRQQMGKEEIELIKRINISDSEFRRNCLGAMNECKKYILIFYLLEKISITVEQFASLFAIIADSYEVSLGKVICISIVMFMIVLLDSLGDWNRLREKYSNLYKSFETLSVSKDEQRGLKFEKLCTSFSKDNLSIDSIHVKDLINFNDENV